MLLIGFTMLCYPWAWNTPTIGELMREWWYFVISSLPLLMGIWLMTRALFGFAKVEK